jgi:GT2 family glycosyltransferase
MIADRLRALGYRVIAVPEAHYDHDGGASSADVPDALLWRHYRHSERLYTRDYLGWRGRAAILWTVRAGEGAVAAALGLLKPRGRAPS